MLWSGFGVSKQGFWEDRKGGVRRQGGKEKEEEEEEESSGGRERRRSGRKLAYRLGEEEEGRESPA